MPRSRIPNLTPTEVSGKDRDRQLKISLLVGAGEEETQAHSCIVDVDSLRDHVAVTGGHSELRTEFCKKLVESFLTGNSDDAQTKIPFLVFTSSRAYRTLIEPDDRHDCLSLYTLGQNILPLSVNLFELLPDVTVASHVSRLTATFSKIYGLSTGASHALEKIFIAVYERRGWSLLQNTNSRLSKEQDAEYQGDAYPILGEALELMDDTIEACLFEQTVKTEIKTALQAMISSLISGANRFIFNTRSNQSVVELFLQRAVIESPTMRAPQDRALYAAILLNFCEELLGPSTRHLRHLFLLDDCTQMSELFDGVADPEDSENVAKIVTDLDACTRSGQGIVFSGLRGNQFAATGLSQTGLTVIFQERNTRAMSKLGGFLSLNLPSLHVVKSLAPYETMILLNCDNVNEANNQIAMGVKERESGSLGTGGGQIYMLDHTQVRSQAAGIPDELLPELNKDAPHDNHPVKLKGAAYFGDAFDLDSLTVAEKLLQTKSFYSVFVRYIASFSKDMTQLVHSRAQLIHEVQRLTGRKTPEFLRKISWCSISIASERYLGAKALNNYWTLDQERNLLHGWFELMAPAFVPDFVNPNLKRRLDISQVREWRDEFLDLQKVEQGPFPACGPCTSKCLLAYDVSQFLCEPGLFFDFNSAISRRDAPASDSSAWYVRLLCERLIGHFDLDLSYCLAVHFIKTQQLSVDAQLVLLRKVRQHLEQVGRGDETDQADRGKKGDEVRILQFPKITRE